MNVSQAEFQNMKEEIVKDLIARLMDERGLTMQQAFDAVYTSRLFLHILEFCLRYVHTFVSFSIACWVQKAYWKVMPLMYWMRRRNSSKVM